MTTSSQPGSPKGLADEWRRGDLVHPDPNNRFAEDLLRRVKDEARIDPLAVVTQALREYRLVVRLWVEVDAQTVATGVGPATAMDEQFRSLADRERFDGITFAARTFYQQLRDRAHAVLDGGGTWEQVPEVWEAVVMESAFARLAPSAHHPPSPGHERER